MKKTHKRFTKQPFLYSRAYLVWPVVLLILSVVLMLLPLEGAVASIKTVTAYVFIPQIRAAHRSMEYSADTWNTVKELLDVHRENEQLKERLNHMLIENAQAREMEQENKRLTAALQLRAPRGWRGVWAKTAYREPNQWNSVVIDKGRADGIAERAAVVAQLAGQLVLAGVVIEVSENTAKVLLLRDEDFAAAVYTDPTADEGLLTGNGPMNLKMNYLPLLSKVKEGDKVYTSPSSSIFPSGILVGCVSEVEQDSNTKASLTVWVEPAAAEASIRELFVLTRPEEIH